MLCSMRAPANPNTPLTLSVTYKDRLNQTATSRQAALPLGTWLSVLELHLLGRHLHKLRSTLLQHWLCAGAALLRRACCPPC